MTQRKKTQSKSRTNKGTEITVAQIGLVTAVLVAIVSGAVTIISSYFSSQAAQAPIIIPIQATQTAEAQLTDNQDNSYATQVALQLTQLSILQEMATSQAQSIVNFSPTATAFAQQIAEMQSALDRVPTPPVSATSQETKNLDIVFMFDTSASLAQNLGYIEFQSFSRNILAEVRVNSDNRIGIISFSANAKVIQTLSNNFTGSDSLITNSVYTDFGSETATFTALNAAYEMLIGQERANTQQVIILFTDGVPYQSDRENTRELTFKIAEIIKSHNIKIVSVLPNSVSSEYFSIYSNDISSDGFVFNASNTSEVDIRLLVETLLK